MIKCPHCGDIHESNMFEGIEICYACGRDLTGCAGIIYIGEKMKLTREQVDEIMEKIGPIFGASPPHILETKKALESFLEKEYKCPGCGYKLKWKGNPAFTTCVNEVCILWDLKWPSQRIPDMACYQDDWNNGKS